MCFWPQQESRPSVPLGNHQSVLLTLMATRTDATVGYLVGLGEPTSSLKGALLWGTILVCLLDLWRVLLILSRDGDGSRAYG